MNQYPCGHYVVDDKIFTEKFDALLYSSQTDKKIIWNFHDNVWKAIDWTIEPTISLDELYKLRAKQLREYYDHIIVFCSGGADSTQVAYSFLKNNIPLDEVYAGAPLSYTNNKKFDKNDTSVFNVVAETVFTQIPFLKEIESTYPEVKISINDYVDDILNYKSDEWLIKSSDWIHPTTVARYSLEKFDHIKQLIEKGKKVAAIYGNSKPEIVLDKDGVFSNFFSDLGLNVARPAFKDLPIDIVNFYTSPDFPLIPIKQSHELLKAYKKFDYVRELVRVKSINFYTKNTIPEAYYGKPWSPRVWESEIIPFIYPSLNYDKFQGGKSKKYFMSEHDSWFYQEFKDHRSYQMMLSDLSNFTKSFDVKYFRDNRKQNLHTFRKKYSVGKIEKED